MNVPLILLAGEAGSGKDTAAAAIVNEFPELNPVAIGQADEIKRFAGFLFDFTPAQLWGPSENRNTQDPRCLSSPADLWDNATERANSGKTAKWIEKLGHEKAGEVFDSWFEGLDKAYRYTLSPRVVLQTLGTEFGRSLDANVWSRLTLDTAFRALNGGYLYTRSGGLVPENMNHDLVVITDGRFRNEVLNVKRAGGLTMLIKRFPTKKSGGPGIKDHASEALSAIPNFWFDVILENNFEIDRSYFEQEVIDYVSGALYP